MLTREDNNQLRYTIALVAEFAQKFNLQDRQAFNYIKRFKGLEYLNNFYDILHTLSFEEVIEALTIICKRNGGQLTYK